jgi:hypothetical protein
MRFCEWQLHRKSKDLQGGSDKPCSNGGVFGAANVVTNGTGSRSNRKAAAQKQGTGCHGRVDPLMKSWLYALLAITGSARLWAGPQPCCLGEALNPEVL